MLRLSSSRIAVIISIFIVLAALSANGFLSSGFNVAQSAAVETQDDFATESATSKPIAMTTPLNAITSFDAALIVRRTLNLQPAFNADQMVVADSTGIDGITSLDATSVGNYVVNNSFTYRVGSTVPPGLLIGDVSGVGPHYDGSPGTGSFIADDKCDDRGLYSPDNSRQSNRSGSDIL
ncbi:MAG: hypothetical protein ACKVRN_07710 [Pyrinomonadaceae bacterium]